MEEPSPLAGAAAPPMSLAQLYADWLFHGPRLQGIVAVRALSAAGASALLRPSRPVDCLDPVPAQLEWLVDPVLVDSALQLQLIWGRANWGATSLPAALGAWRIAPALIGRSVRQAARLVGSADREPLVRCELRIRPDSAPPVNRADHCFGLLDGGPLALMDEMEVSGSPALNRLVGHR
jgi:hypothetical protein